MSKPYQPNTGLPCSCKRGRERDNCPACKGTGWQINFRAIDCVRDFLDGNIKTGKLLMLVPNPRDLIGCFSNIIDEDRNNIRCTAYAVEEVITCLDSLEGAIAQLRSAIEPLKKG